METLDNETGSVRPLDIYIAHVFVIANLNGSLPDLVRCLEQSTPETFEERGLRGIGPDMIGKRKSA